MEFRRPLSAARIAVMPIPARAASFSMRRPVLNRQEFVIVGWTDPEGSRSSLGSLLLGYYRDDGKLIYAGAPARA